MFQLPKLPYAYDALEPFIDAKTMEIHHSKHHAAYVDNLNNALGGMAMAMEHGANGITVAHQEFLSMSPEELLRNIEKIPESVRAQIRNNGGGHYNHSLFWEVMKPKGGGEPADALKAAIEKAFGNFAAFRDQFGKTALGRFGSGWGWLVWTRAEGLKIASTQNQDSPVSDGAASLLAIDVWEHAYYLKYQNRRAEYIENWWNVVNWEKVAELYAKALNG